MQPDQSPAPGQWIYSHRWVNLGVFPSIRSALNTKAIKLNGRSKKHHLPPGHPGKYTPANDHHPVFKHDNPLDLGVEYRPDQKQR